MFLSQICEVGGFAIIYMKIQQHYHEDFSLFFAKNKNKNPLYHLVCHQDMKNFQTKTLICMLFKGDFRQGVQGPGTNEFKQSFSLKALNCSQGL
jgi:hypothetical protein